MDWFENLELSGYALPNFPCFCVSSDFGPSLQHLPAGWFTINCFTQLLRIKAVGWYYVPNRDQIPIPAPQIILTLRILESLKRPPIPSPFVLSNIREKMKMMRN